MATYVPAWPTRIAVDYARTLRAWIARWEREAIAALLSPEVVAATIRNRRARGLDDTGSGPLGLVHDIAGDEVDRALDRMVGDLQRLQPDQDLGRDLLRHAHDTDAFTRREVERQLKAAAGRDILAPAQRGGELVSEFVQDNVRLITKMRQSTRDEIEEYIRRGWRAGLDTDAIAKTIRNRFKHIKKTRAHLIAADQIGKLNGELTRARLLGAGVQRGRWRTRRDRRVRHAHRMLEGRSFDLRVGVPVERFPGWPVRCRCWTEPVLEDKRAIAA